MYQRTTQDESTDCCKIVKKEDVSWHLIPRKETLAFITQFSYSYHVEKQLPLALSAMILN
jgi:hypothetical protein